MITREQIKEEALKLRGIKFLHQGRNVNGVDCVGLLVMLGKALGIEKIHDIEGYKRVPKAEEITATLHKNLDEIPLKEVGVGDMFQMKLFSCKARHVAIYMGGINPQILHAHSNGVQLNWVADFPKSWYVTGFRVRGLVEGE